MTKKKKIIIIGIIIALLLLTGGYLYYLETRTFTPSASDDWDRGGDFSSKDTNFIF